MRRLAFALIALASILLIAMPAAADFALEIYGNANQDDTIDWDDVKFVQGIINGSNNATELADANYDGIIDDKDIAQIELIMQGKEKNLTITQYLKTSKELVITKKPVTVTIPIKSIAALSGTYGPYMLCALGDNDKIVAVLSGAMERGEIKDLIDDKSVVGTSNDDWDMEKILKIKPDIVLGYASFDLSEQRKILEASGIALVQMNFNRPETYKNEVRIIGWLLGKQERAEKLINFEQEHMDFIKERTENLSREEMPRVYAETYRDYRYGGSSSSIGLSVGPCGGIDIFEQVGVSTDIDPEEVISKDPQVIIHMTAENYISDSGYNAINSSQIEKRIADIENRTGWDHIDAVKDGKVYIITSDAASIHPSIFQTYVAKWLHPELFKDLDPVAVHEEWLQKFLGIKYKGVFAYPLL
ncbi:MAG: ABC transporter substrate-binding protein [Methanothrix sp.]|jgi:iron complex transport system substrate-binding protein|nr:ABC transporter substrate-binding protein [Methanothrix sp.]